MGLGAFTDCCMTKLSDVRLAIVFSKYFRLYLSILDSRKESSMAITCSLMHILTQGNMTNGENGQKTACKSAPTATGAAL